MQHLHKTRGRGAVIVNQESNEDSCPERRSGVEDRSSHFRSERRSGAEGSRCTPNEGICPEKHCDEASVPIPLGAFRPFRKGSLSPVRFQRIPSLSHLTRTPARISPRC